MRLRVGRAPFVHRRVRGHNIVDERADRAFVAVTTQALLFDDRLRQLLFAQRLVEPAQTGAWLGGCPAVGV